MEAITGGKYRWSKENYVIRPFFSREYFARARATASLSLSTLSVPLPR